MMATYQQILDDVLGLMTTLSEDWEYSGEISAETRLLGDLAMDSLDLVILGSELRDRYGDLPFSEFLAELGRKEADERDVRVSQLVDLVARLKGAAVPGEVVR